MGVPKGHIFPEAMKYLDYNQIQLMYACTGSNVSSVRWYLSQGASPSIYDENRTSPLHVACRQGSFQVVEELLNNGAPVDITDCAGWTCLHIAAYCCRPDIVYLLLKHGADATLMNRTGETSWDLAGDESTQEVFHNYFRARGEEDDSIGSVGSSSNSPRKHRYYLAMKSMIHEHIINVGPRRPKTPGDVSPLMEERSLNGSMFRWFKIFSGRFMGLNIQNKEIYKERFIKIFNNSGIVGLSYMIMIGILPNDVAKIARYLYETTEICKKQTGEVLGTQHSFYKTIASSFLSFIHFEQLDIVSALRKLLSRIVLPSAGVSADQILSCFAEEIYKKNGSFISTVESIHNLAFSIIMLDYSLHEDISTPISKEHFIKSNAGMDDGEDFPEYYLSFIYEEISKSSVRSPHPPSNCNTFEGSIFSGFLSMKTPKHWKQRFFVLHNEGLYFLKSAESRIPYGLIPVQGLQIRRQRGGFSCSYNPQASIAYIKINEEGLVKRYFCLELVFKCTNPSSWSEAFAKVPIEVVD